MRNLYTTIYFHTNGKLATIESESKKIWDRMDKRPDVFDFVEEGKKGKKVTRIYSCDRKLINLLF